MRQLQIDKESNRLLTDKIKANKFLSQNFLPNQRIISKIVDYSNLNQNDVIFEIGAGSGYLTEHLLKNCKYVVAVEIDKRLCNLLTEKFKKYINFKLINDDILNINLKSILSGYDNWKLIANIPYHITSKIFFLILENRDKFEFIIILMQKELAKRIMALKQKNSKLIGSITIAASLCFKIEKLLLIKGSSFYPSASVDSQLVRLYPLPFHIDEKNLLKWIHKVFNFRRKKLSTIFSNHLRCETLLSTEKKLLNNRPQMLSTFQWLYLYQIYINGYR